MASPPSADQSNKVKVMQMQVDSPCHSPKMTPAGSLTNIASVASAGAVPSSSTDRDEMPMDVEMASVTREDEAIEESKGCDTNKDNVEKSVSSGVPCPRHISDVELQVIKVHIRRADQVFYNLSHCFIGLVKFVFMINMVFFKLGLLGPVENRGPCRHSSTREGHR